MHENLWEPLIYEALPRCIWSPNLLAHLTSGARRPNVAVISEVEVDGGCPESWFGSSWTGTGPKDCPVSVLLFFFFCPLMLMMKNSLNICPKCNNIHSSSNNSLTQKRKKNVENKQNLAVKKRPQIQDTNSHGTHLKMTPCLVIYGR